MGLTTYYPDLKREWVDWNIGQTKEKNNRKLNDRQNTGYNEKF